MNRVLDGTTKASVWSGQFCWQWASAVLPALLLPALFSPVTLAAEKLRAPDELSSPAAPASPAPQPSGIVVIRADQQGYDQQLGRFVASGNVEARFNGWRLLADRVELAEGSRSVYASGQIRLTKGDQYLQASRLRYSDWEGTGEIEDVYGVIDQDTLARDVNSPEAAPNATSPGPSFACPPLSANPSARPLVRVLPPGSDPESGAGIGGFRPSPGGWAAQP
jgi:lipopolysaccharide export system protein LptA